MYQKARQDAILDILQKEGYVTVAYLTEQLHYSTATINRDLNQLADQGLVRRSYGGAELVDNHRFKLPFRYHIMKAEKRRIAQAAAALIQSGDTVFINGSTTTESMAPYLTDIEQLTVITNNMALATYLSDCGVKTICLGGQVVEAPSMLGGNATAQQASLYPADKLFFSTAGFTPQGRVGASAIDSIYSPMLRAMMENAAESYFLIDHEKIDWSIKEYFCDFGQLTGVISDYDFPEETKNRFPDTEFICVK